MNLSRPSYDEINVSVMLYRHHYQHVDDLLSITTKDTFKFVKDAVVFIQVAQPAA